MGVLTACAPRVTDKLILAPVSFDQVPGWAADDHAAALPALRRSCPSNVNASAKWKPVCAALAALPDGDRHRARRFFEKWFTPHRASNGGEEQGLFTGYFEPELHGARARGGRYTVPLYARPPDLVAVNLGKFREKLAGERIAGRVNAGRLEPFETRAAIDKGALAGRGLELLWVDDAIDAFFLHIQGSGRVVTPDGGTVRVGYAASNGHPYFAIGRDLVARGAIPVERISMQSIRAWMAAHPAAARDLMARNPSYIFFREINGDGPIGTQGVALTPGRSLAVDRVFIGLGSPVWLDTVDPLDPARALRRLMIAQDTGGAIRGPVRGDVFWGHGAEAARRAGQMKSSGRYFILLPK